MNVFTLSLLINLISYSLYINYKKSLTDPKPLKISETPKHNCLYLLSIFALSWAKDPVIQRIQGIVEVRLLKAVVIQNLQRVQNPADGETYGTHHGPYITQA